MELLLDRRGGAIKITNEVAKIAAHCDQESVLNLLQRRFTVDISVYIRMWRRGQKWFRTQYCLPIAYMIDPSKRSLREYLNINTQNR